MFFQSLRDLKIIGPLNNRGVVGPLDGLPELVQDPDPNLPLNSAIDAVVLAFWQNRHGCVAGIPTPSTMYTVALKGLNAALTSPKYYKRDETLLAIWVLGMYEVRFGSYYSLMTIIKDNLRIVLTCILSPR